MKFIDKLHSPEAQCGTELTQEIVDSYWIKHEGRYNDFTYQKRKMEGMVSTLCSQQENCCCYCMKKLHYEDGNGNITLEHVIPNKIAEQKWNHDKSDYLKNDYLKKVVSDGNGSVKPVEICFEGKVKDNETRITSIPFPHFVSYHNIVVSCDGCLPLTFKSSQCCNNKRSDDFVYPFYFDSDIENKIGYDSQGEFDYDPDDFDKEKMSHWLKDVLNIDNTYMRRMRALWCKIVKAGYAENEVIAADEDKRMEIIDDLSADDESWIFDFKKEGMWKWFIEYSWFYQYYKNKSSIVKAKP